MRRRQEQGGRGRRQEGREGGAGGGKGGRGSRRQAAGRKEQGRGKREAAGRSDGAGGSQAEGRRHQGSGVRGDERKREQAGPRRNLQHRTNLPSQAGPSLSRCAGGLAGADAALLPLSRCAPLSVVSGCRLSSVHAPTWMEEGGRREGGRLLVGGRKKEGGLQEGRRGGKAWQAEKGRGRRGGWGRAISPRPQQAAPRSPGRRLTTAPRRPRAAHPASLGPPEGRASTPRSEGSKRPPAAATEKLLPEPQWERASGPNTRTPHGCGQARASAPSLTALHSRSFWVRRMDSFRAAP